MSHMPDYRLVRTIGSGVFGITTIIQAMFSKPKIKKPRKKWLSNG